MQLGVNARNHEASFEVGSSLRIGKRCLSPTRQLIYVFAGGPGACGWIAYIIRLLGASFIYQMKKGSGIKLK